MAESHAVAWRIPFAHTIRSTRSHVIANGPQLATLYAICRVVVSIDTSYTAHVEVSADLDHARPRGRTGWDTARYKASQCRANALEALAVTPLPDARQACLALALPQPTILDETEQRPGKPFNVSCRWGKAIDAILDKVDCTSDLL